ASVRAEPGAAHGGRVGCAHPEGDRAGLRGGSAVPGRAGRVPRRAQGCEDRGAAVLAARPPGIHLREVQAATGAYAVKLAPGVGNGVRGGKGDVRYSGDAACSTRRARGRDVVAPPSRGQAGPTRPASDRKAGTYRT